MLRQDPVEMIRLEREVEEYRRTEPGAAAWAAGYGAIRHSVETQARVFRLAERWRRGDAAGDGVELFELLRAADRVACAAMWLVVHETYADNLYLDGRALVGADFKSKPEGHTGGALNMVPAYVGYMTANVVSGFTRAWLMGQGHCVAAIDSVNLLLDNMTPAHAARYDLSEAGLRRYIRDYYAYQLGTDGRQLSPLGSHVNAHTAGGLAEGGYLGFAELQYPHMPLPGERLVCFLSDGAFEEQRGSDWAPRWWRADDCGLIAPIMIANGRRIDQRTTMAQSGGVDWLVQHLALNHFDPIVIDGRDPAAFVWLILEMEARLQAAAATIARDEAHYPVRLPYGVAVAPKGAGFYGEGTNLAHNLPLSGSPRVDPHAADEFNQSARRLWVPLDELQAAGRCFGHHPRSGRVKERDNPLACREVTLGVVPDLKLQPISADRLDRTTWTRASPMAAIDQTFLDIVRANPGLRPRVGNPDEMRSNRMQQTLDHLKFRVTAVEPGIPEALDGAVITALNEEAVASAALANKGGINLIVTYEAFGAKMHGAVRQEIIFAHNAIAAGRPPGWLSVPLALTSHNWENGKNEQSHQDPAMAELMLNEPSDISRVMFVPDANTAATVLRAAYQSRGQIWTIVAPKSPVADLFSADEAARLLADGAIRLDWASFQPDKARLIITAIGAYQLAAILTAANQLRAESLPFSVIAMLEPGRFRQPRGDRERAHNVADAIRANLYPHTVVNRLFVTHTRPEPLLGALQPLNTGFDRTIALGYINQGGTLDTAGMLTVNHTDPTAILAACRRLITPTTFTLDQVYGSVKPTEPIADLQATIDAAQDEQAARVLRELRQT